MSKPKETLTISQLEHARTKLESDMMNLIDDFTRETGCRITDIECVRTMSPADRSPYVYKIRAEVGFW
jgi:hypothetical protein